MRVAARLLLLLLALLAPAAAALADRLDPLEPLPTDPDALLALQFEQRRACSRRTRGFLAALAPPYTASAFFDCWRSAGEMDAFLSALAIRHPSMLTRAPAVAVSAEGRSIPAFQLSANASAAATAGDKPAVYLQGVAHAREWQAGSAVAFTAAAMLDGLLSGDADVLEAAEAFAWLLVPVLNVDGYAYSRARPETRFWRKNRRRVRATSGRGGAVGVDLNRNFPVPLGAPAVPSGGPSADTYAGPRALSEPEAAGLDAWLRARPLRGAIDFHAFGALVLSSPGDRALAERLAPGADVLARARRLADAVAAALPAPYESRAACELYASTGSLMDALLLGRDEPVAALTVELAGDSFVADARSIRRVGGHALRAALALARALPAFYNRSSSYPL